MLHTEGTCTAGVHVSVPFPPDEQSGRRGEKHATRVQPTAGRQRRGRTQRNVQAHASKSTWHKEHLLEAPTSSACAHRPGSTTPKDTRWDWMRGEERRLSGCASDPERLGANPRPTTPHLQDRRQAPCPPQPPPARSGGRDFCSGNPVSASDKSRVGKASGAK